MQEKIDANVPADMKVMKARVARRVPCKFSRKLFTPEELLAAYHALAKHLVDRINENTGAINATAYLHEANYAGPRPAEAPYTDLMVRANWVQTLASELVQTEYALSHFAPRERSMLIANRYEYLLGTVVLNARRNLDLSIAPKVQVLLYLPERALVRLGGKVWAKRQMERAASLNRPSHT